MAGAWPIIAVDRLAPKLDLARRCGATHTINAADTDAVAAVRGLPKGGGESAFEGGGKEVVTAQADADPPGGGKRSAHR